MTLETFKGHTVLFTDKEQKQRMQNDIDRYTNSLTQLKSEIAALKKEREDVINAAKDEAKLIVKVATDTAREMRQQAQRIINKSQEKNMETIKKAEKVAALLIEVSDAKVEITKQLNQVTDLKSQIVDKIIKVNEIIDESETWANQGKGDVKDIIKEAENTIKKAEKKQ